jgi:hypothetical protein
MRPIGGTARFIHVADSVYKDTEHLEQLRSASNALRRVVDALHLGMRDAERNKAEASSGSSRRDEGKDNKP